MEKITTSKLEKINFYKDEEIFVKFDNDDKGIYAFQYYNEDDETIVLHNENGLSEFQLENIESIERWDIMGEARKSEIEESICYEDEADIEEVSNDCMKETMLDGEPISKYIKKRLPNKVDGIPINPEKKVEYVEALLDEKGELFDYFKKFNNRINKVYDKIEGMSNKEKSSFYKTIYATLKPLDVVVEYLVGYQHSQKRLNRQYYDGSLHLNKEGTKTKRKFNQVNVSQLIKEMPRTEDINQTDLERVEYKARKNGCLEDGEVFDENVIENLLEPVTDELEKEIGRLRLRGYSKKETWEHFGLTDGKLRTKLKHIKKQIDDDNNPVKIPKIKLCRICGVKKPVSAFGKNSRMPDKLQTACKICINGRN